MTEAPTVYVVEDNPAFSDAVVLTLESAEMNVRACADADEFLGIYNDEPGCLLTDVRMPRMSGLELQQHLAERDLHIPIVFMTGHGDVATSVTALKRGAVDFLEKPFGAAALLGSVREALARDAVARQIDNERSLVEARFRLLSERESRVMEMVIAGWSNKEIARGLAISPRTVDHHREHVMTKMEAGSLNDLIVMGLICGLRELRLRPSDNPADAAASRTRHRE